MATGCPSIDIHVEEGDSFYKPLEVEGCGGSWLCFYGSKTARYSMDKMCLETPRSKMRRKNREERVDFGKSVSMSKDRLGIETGCPPDNIWIVSSSEWRNGRERAHRVAGCGTIYVCTTNISKTECKKALIFSAEELVRPTPEEIERKRWLKHQAETRRQERGSQGKEKPAAGPPPGGYSTDEESP